MTYPCMRLGTAIQHRSEFVFIDDLTEYKRCRVQLHAQGVVQRDIVFGASVKTKKQQVCKAGEFLVAEIDAKLGGFGIVPDNLDGAIVSSHYFLFKIDSNILDREFLAWFIRTDEFLEQVAAQGSTNYAAIRPFHVLDYLVPLPSIHEQRRVAKRIRQIAEKLSEAESSRKRQQAEITAICRALINTGKTVRTPMATVLTLREPDVIVDRSKEYSFAGVYCFGRGVFKGATKPGTAFAYDRLTRLREGEFVYPKLMAWEGALGIVPTECDGLVVSTEFPVFKVRTEHVLPETLDVYFRSPSVWPELAAVSTGTNVRRRRLHPNAFLKYEMPLPTIETQIKLREVKRFADKIERLRKEGAPALNALIPSVLKRAFQGAL